MRFGMKVMNQKLTERLLKELTQKDRKATAADDEGLTKVEEHEAMFRNTDVKDGSKTTTMGVTRPNNDDGNDVLSPTGRSKRLATRLWDRARDEENENPTDTDDHKIHWQTNIRNINPVV